MPKRNIFAPLLVFNIYRNIHPIFSKRYFPQKFPITDRRHLKGAALGRRFWGLVTILLILSNAPAFSQNGPRAEAISREEYDLFRLVLETQSNVTAVNPETLAGIQADADWLKPPVGFQLPPDLVKDFNEKNSKAFGLSAVLPQQMPQSPVLGSEGKKRITFSRAGFDSDRRHALLIMAISYYLPEDVMNEGTYIFMEKLDGRWTVRDTAAAWDMRLGSIP